MRTIAIIGSGRSLRDLPRDYTFTCDSAGLNASVCAPQFYDWQAEKYWQPWTYAFFVDYLLLNKRYFDHYYYQQAVANEQGKVIVPTKPSAWLTVRQPNVEWYDTPRNYKAVLLMALDYAESKQYDRVVLFGCDFCRSDHYRYWWEDEPLVLNHPRNKTAFVKAVREQYEQRSDEHVKVIHRFAGTTTITPYSLDTGGNKVLYDATYKRHCGMTMARIKALNEKGVEVVKYPNKGMLDIPVITLDKLENCEINLNDKSCTEALST